MSSDDDASGNVCSRFREERREEAKERGCFLVLMIDDAKRLACVAGPPAFELLSPASQACVCVGVCG